MKNSCYFFIFLILLAIQNFANDLEPVNPSIHNGSTYILGSSIPINFDVRFNCNYPVNAGECNATIKIKNQNNVVLWNNTISNITGNGPTNIPSGNCDYNHPVDKNYTVSGGYNASETGTFTLVIDINYIYDINTANNEISSTFSVNLPPQPPKPVTNIFPQNGAINISPNPPVILKWDNGTNSFIEQQVVEIKQGNVVILTQELPPTVELFTSPNPLEPFTGYDWTLTQSNSVGETVNGPFSFFTTGENTFNFNFEVNHINYLYYLPPAPVGLITVNYTPAEKGTYLNVFAEDNDTSGKILGNLFLPPSSIAETPTAEFSTTFDFTKISATPFKEPFNIKLFAYVSESPQLSDSLPVDRFAYIDSSQVTEINYGPKGSDVPEYQQIQTTPVTTIEHNAGDTQTDYQYRPDPDNLDLNSFVHPATSTFAGDLNACVPTATANSMKWLERAYKNVRLPGDMDLRKTMETLSGLMKRETEKGTSTENMLLGKLDFIEQYKLPLEVKFQALYVSGNVNSTSGDSKARNFNKGIFSNDPPTWDFLKEMIDDDEDVEMNYTWYDSTSKQYYAHSVNLTGVTEFKSGVKKITFKHDLYQEYSGGLKQEIHQISIDENGWMRFGQHNENYIRDVVAESPVASFEQKAGAFLNEILAFTGLFKSNSRLSASATDEFIEIIAKQNIPDLHKYRVTVYNGTGEQVVKITLDQFTTGTSVDSFAVYTYTFTGNVLPDANGAVGIAFSGSPIEESFISWGGNINAVNGDFTSLTSKDIGVTPQAGYSFALSGYGTSYQDFSWVSNPNPSPGELNPSQTVPVELTSFVASIEKDGVLLKWITATEINNKGFEIQRSQVSNQRLDVGKSGNQLPVITDKWEVIGFVDGSGSTTEVKEYSFKDRNLSAGKYSYRLKQIDLDGSYEYSNIVEVNVVAPVKFELAQNYPNPFNPVTTIEYSIPKPGRVTLIIYNLLGQTVATIVDENKEAGVHRIQFNGKDLNSGAYFYRLTSGRFTQTRKLLLMK
jgi:hypothetical protein